MMDPDNTTVAMSSAKDAMAMILVHQEPRVALAVVVKMAARDVVVVAEAATVAVVVATKAAPDLTRASMAVLVVIALIALIAVVAVVVLYIATKAFYMATVAAEVVPAVALLPLINLRNERANFPRGLFPLESFC